MSRGGRLGSWGGGQPAKRGQCPSRLWGCSLDLGFLVSNVGALAVCWAVPSPWETSAAANPAIFPQLCP